MGLKNNGRYSFKICGGSWEKRYNIRGGRAGEKSKGTSGTNSGHRIADPIQVRVYYVVNKLCMTVSLPL